jgi:hypothetical protein
LVYTETVAQKLRVALNRIAITELEPGDVVYVG